MKPVLVTSGEPAGVGPDICLMLASHALPLVVMGDHAMLAKRAQQLGLAITLHEYRSSKDLILKPNHLNVLSLACDVMPTAGVLDPRNADYVIRMLTQATERCLQDEFSAMVTAPVHKAILNEGGFNFSGHTELLATLCQAKHVVMMLVSPQMKVALVTTHLPLKSVADAITPPLIIETIHCLHEALQKGFGILAPKIFVAGLNPHAGENGYLGREELDIIKPTLLQLQHEGIDVHGPFSADTLFSKKNLAACDAFVAMYHDQGLTVLKYASFGQAVNITLGLPIIRTSVDHGTAIELAATGKAEAGSLLFAVETAQHMAKQKG